MKQSVSIFSYVNYFKTFKQNLIKKKNNKLEIWETGGYVLLAPLKISYISKKKTRSLNQPCKTFNNEH